MLKGSIALITGGGSGIGRATCQRFAAEGASVVVADIKQESAEETLHSLTGDGHTSLRMDVSNTKEVECGVREIKFKYSSPPNIVVNCAGVVIVESLLDLTDEAFQRVMDVNVKGTMMVTKMVCKELIEAGKKGSIVNVSSIAASSTYVAPGQALYSASKSAVNAFTKTASKEMLMHNIRINSVMPGLVNTPMVASVPHDTLQSYVPQGALDHPAEPKEIAEVILFLASDRSSYVNGSLYIADGGFM